MSKGVYTKDGRLQDVIALIQVLALDPHTHRSPEGLEKELQGKPSSSESWVALAKEHREFFRVSAESEHPVSLVARHVVPREEDRKPQLEPGFTNILLQTAVALHDRQVQAAERWKPFLLVLFGALIPLLTQIVQHFIK